MLSTTKVAVVEAFRGGHDVFEVPLWLRLEQNHIDDAETVFRRLQDVFFHPFSSSFRIKTPSKQLGSRYLGPVEGLLTSPGVFDPKTMILGHLR